VGAEGLTDFGPELDGSGKGSRCVHWAAMTGFRELDSLVPCTPERGSIGFAGAAGPRLREVGVVTSEWLARTTGRVGWSEIARAADRGGAVSRVVDSTFRHRWTIVPSAWELAEGWDSDLTETTLFAADVGG
jgi:hypothetical protein